MYEAIDRYVHSLIENSTVEKTAWNIEKMRQGIPADWNYIDGCMITALLNLYEITGEDQYFEFCDRFIDHFILEDGSVRGYKTEGHSLDDINEGRVLFTLYNRTGKEKYRRAMEFLHVQLKAQPRTSEGNFWHKQIYPNQVWLDGIYMAQPFAALYEKVCGNQNYEDIIHQIENVRAKMRDPKTGLYYHGYDASRKAFWCNPETGCSENFWLRSLGWFAVALVDLLEILPEEKKDPLIRIFVQLMEDVYAYCDAESGMYWQVVDQGGREGNYLESSGSAMLSYAMLKGARMKVLAPEYAQRGKKTFDGIVKRCLRMEGGLLEMNSICLVAGLGPETNRRRDGSYAYYISEPIVSNDAKGVAPFILSYTEVKRL